MTLIAFDGRYLAADSLTTTVDNLGFGIPDKRNWNANKLWIFPETINFHWRDVDYDLLAVTATGTVSEIVGVVDFLIDSPHIDHDLNKLMRLLHQTPLSTDGSIFFFVGHPTRSEEGKERKNILVILELIPKQNVFDNMGKAITYEYTKATVHLLDDINYHHSIFSGTKEQRLVKDVFPDTPLSSFNLITIHEILRPDDVGGEIRYVDLQDKELEIKVYDRSTDPSFISTTKTLYKHMMKGFTSTFHNRYNVPFKKKEIVDMHKTLSE